MERLKDLDVNSVDSVVTDPPYGLSKEPDINEVLSKWLAGEEYDHGHGGFMGKSWDSFVPHPDIWAEVYRVLKPGGHALVFAGTRTQDLMTISLRMAGFEVRDVIQHIFFSGFPKSHDVSKAFDRRAGAERKKVPNPLAKKQTQAIGTNAYGDYNAVDYVTPEPATELAKKYSGWGTALKPAHEPIIVVRKPLIDADTGRKLSVADCVEKYGTGAINIDASRIAMPDVAEYLAKQQSFDGTSKRGIANGVTMNKSQTQARKSDEYAEQTAAKGRFPANCITLDGDAFYSKYFNITPQELSKKASKKDRNSDWKGEEIEGNVHPTVKNTDLMAWLVRLITPEGGTVLDPFAGSGSTLVAAKREGFGFIGVELTDEYIPIIEARAGVTAE